MKLRYFSGCSGIEAASIAWTSLGWVPVAFSEIEPFPSAVLTHHYPGVPNLGDMTCVDGTAYRGLVDVLVAGTPCQPYSVAGLRLGLSDERGNLTLKFVELANAIEPSVAVVWENVPGVLSSKDNAFGCFLGGLAGSDGPLVPARPGKWSNSGYVLGPRRAIAWRVLDAQYFGLAQRRRRVYVVACPRNGLDPAEILFEFDGVRRDTPPRREARKDVACTIEASFGRSRGAGINPGTCGEVCQSLTRSLGSGGPDDNKAQAGFYVSQYGDVAATLTSEGADASPCANRGPTVIAFHGSQDPNVSGDVTHPVGRNQGQEMCVAFIPEQTAFGGNNTAGAVDVATACRAKGGTGHGDFDSETFVLCRPTHDVATSVTGRDPSRGADSDFTSTHVVYSAYSTSGAPDSHENIVSSSAIAFTERGRAKGRTFEYQEEQAYCLMNPGSGGRTHSRQIMTSQRQVRRLTPIEGERLQGFPDNYTRIAWRGSPPEECPDGPRYKAVGNSMPTTVMRWIGERIERAILQRAST